MKKTITKETPLGRFTVTLEYKSLCNQAPYFSITGSNNYSCGCNHDEIRKYFPELAHLIRWHLFSLETGPMHYVANTLYLVSNRDYNGLLKDETKQEKYYGTRSGPNQPDRYWYHTVLTDETGAVVDIYKLHNHVAAETCPTEVKTLTLTYVPTLITGTGKERNLDAARQAASWPDATDEQLLSPNLKELLLARLPSLKEQFKADMLAIGFDVTTAP